MPPPDANFAANLPPEAQDLAAGALRRAVVGDPAQVRRGLTEFAARHAADELIVTSSIFDHGARLRSFEIVADAGKELALAA